MTTRDEVPGWGLAALALLLALAPAWLSAQAPTDPKGSRLPAAVLVALETNCPGAQIDKIDVEEKAGIRLYDIELVAGGEIEVVEDGTVLEVATIVPLADVPEAVAAAIRQAAGAGTVREVERAEVRARIEKTDGKGRLVPVTPPEYMYEAELPQGGEIEVTAAGKVVKGPKDEAEESPDQK